MSKNTIGAATPVDLTDWARVAAMTDEEIAFDQDNPATTEADWAGAVMKVGDKTVGRTVGRPVSDRPKVATTMRLDADVLATFKAGGKGWQTRINQVLRDYVRTHTP